jgi:type II secretory pathway pseudopilin PulG
MRKLSAGAAFSLVEVTFALGIAAFCLIAVFGLMPVGVQTNRNATSQTAATNIITTVVADIRATPKTTASSATSAQFGINIPTDPTSPADPPPCSGTQTFYLNREGQVVTIDARYRVVITFIRNPTATATTRATYARLKVSWPALADPCTITPSGSVEMFTAFDRN